MIRTKQINPPPVPPTTEQFSSYQVMFDHFNRELFADQLPHVILNFSRDLKTAVGLQLGCMACNTAFSCAA